ncbi:dTDP-4-dehydrorhamnose 3,5-epimerase domain protein [Leptospira interrogans serovar Grippotyphosa str. LT2186]|uniref:dTDP-4-dehydrorhamnose 3,5-epimerase domain protein n=1 Tax=Leptospira interrogans serovar Grippotyphosa str. LT2186 TaxID=1001599 RepID=M3HJ58_LEPIR|nr:dTDP-4-dehydrorhamnose 3,5-epimerase domain protein [Leptospira interrogans serovar Grippotyphosa str. LT2186]
MQFKKFQIEGPVLIEPKVFGDERGFFWRPLRHLFSKKKHTISIFPR